MKRLIYSVEDDESIRGLIKYTLTNEGYEVQSFETAEECLAAIEKRPPSLLLLDLMLPRLDGTEAMKIIRDKYKTLNIKIIILTAKSSEINKVEGLNCGADDYMTKPFSVLELAARVRAHLRKYAADVCGPVLEFAGISLNADSREVKADGRPIELTYKEFELLKILLENAGSVLERERLIRELWETEYYGESRTVDIHIKNLRAKLGACGDLIVSARGVGYILKDRAK
ncbi:MAG: response regulator transcription factor [Clostridiales bacterium]|jgi:two-component system alkaline phosphatase synthesis response regulator PhoP|nr:response regulator transcription factor [Clostridiales bacterium]